MTEPPFPHVRIYEAHKSFDTGGEPLHVLDGISLNIAQGEFVSIIGPSGCGKSTLLRLVGGLITAASGDVLIDGLPPAEARANRQLGFVFQDASLLAWRTVAENVRLPFDVNRAGANRRDATHAVDALLSLVGLDGYADYHPALLSGGMRQRVALARALAVGASVLLMDEPFAALDELTRADMHTELTRILSNEQKTVVLVTHSVVEAVTLSDRVVVMSPRPARIVADVSIDLPRPRTTAMMREGEFQNTTHLLHDALLEGSRARGPDGRWLTMADDG